MDLRVRLVVDTPSGWLVLELVPASPRLWAWRVGESWWAIDVARA